MPLEFLIAGVLFVLLSLPLIVLNMLMLITLATHKEFSTGTYRIIKNMCFACILQLLVFFVGGVMTLLGTTVDYFFEKFCGAILSATFLLYLALSATLAIDRLMIFLCLASPANHRISATLLSAAWIFWLAVVVVLVTPNFNFLYRSDFALLGWNYDVNADSTQLATFEMYFDFGTLSFSLLLYITIALILFKSRNSTSHLSSWQAELRVLFVALITFLYELLLICCGFFGLNLLPRSVATPAFFTILWIVDCGLFASVTMLINASIRNKMKHLLLKKRAVVRVTISTSRR